MARLTAERRLQGAEQRLVNLEQGIQDHGKVDSSMKEDKKKEMIGDVKAIRSNYTTTTASVTKFCVHELFYTQASR